MKRITMCHIKIYVIGQRILHRNHITRHVGMDFTDAVFTQTKISIMWRGVIRLLVIEEKKMYKQIIIVRKDLDMSPGKLAAQVSHGSMAFLSTIVRNHLFKLTTNGISSMGR